MRVRLVLAVGCVGVAAVTALAARSASAQQRVPGIDAAAPVCQGTYLSVGQNRQGDQEGMLHRGVDITVTNSGNGPCTLDGYLALRLRDAHDRPLRTVVQRGDTYFETDPGPTMITVQPGAVLAADVAWALPSTPADPHVTPGYLEITTPGARDGAFRVPFRIGPVYRSQLATTALSPFTGPRP